ncbi:MAG: hypothetical protein HY202_08090 [Nitrospirae bacterium]|nr:hypothetical protein [Nitrospirota bacterium]
MSRKISNTVLIFFLFLAFVLTIVENSQAFEFKGFSDIKYNESSQNNYAGGFSLGTFDLYLSQQLNDRIDLLSEIALEFDASADGYGLDVERLQIGYAFNDQFKVRVGRFHNILGYWNTAYHHGAQLQTSVNRPQIVAFEDRGGILPAHLVGLWIDGKFRTEIGKFHYGVMVGDGPKIFNYALQPNAGGDNSSNKAVSYNLSFHPSSVEGLIVGASGAFEQINDFAPLAAPVIASPTVEVDQAILGAHVVYFGDQWEVLSEYYFITDKDKLTQPGSTYYNHGYFFQTGYRLFGSVVPYARYEEAKASSDDPFLKAISDPANQDLQTNLAKATLSNITYVGGIRYDLSQGTSLRGEFQIRNIAGIDAIKLYTLQWAFSF